MKDKNFRWTLRLKFTLMFVGVIILFAISTMAASVSTAKLKLEDVTQGGLQALAYSIRGSVESICDKDLQVDDKTYTLYKGGRNVEDELNMLQDLVMNTNYDITIFYGDTRYITTVESKEHESAIGTKCSTVITNAVLRNGEDYFSPDVIVNGVHYSGFYTPLRNPDGSIVGMVFTGIPYVITRQVTSGIFLSIAVVTIVVGAIAIIALSIMLQQILHSIHVVIDVLQYITNGHLENAPERKWMKRTDEIGDIYRIAEKLRMSYLWIIGSLTKQSGLLQANTEVLSNESSSILGNMRGVNIAVDEIAKAAISQTGDVIQTMDYITQMGTCVDKMRISSEQLHTETSGMYHRSVEVKNCLSTLTQVNGEVDHAVNMIYEQTHTTNRSAEDIRRTIDIIMDIAEETNLLSLNAAIEAAHAGDSGRGFAVVAEQIRKLADQSSQSATEIVQVVNTLLAESKESVNTMIKVKEIVGKQSQTVEVVESHFDELLHLIDNSVENITSVSADTNAVESAREEVVTITQKLAAISEEYTASTEQTSATVTEVGSILNNMNNTVVDLREISNTLELFVSKFTYNDVEMQDIYAAQMKTK